ncbi:MAG: hypothetical protein C4547_07925 [Phycisphaerales bacterium]|nr:MAG: hypothetical protein C4547_07925 [Phycisphaerales bacterium]
MSGRYAFSLKALIEMEADGLTELDVVECIANAVAVYKRLRSTSTRRKDRKEYLYVIQGTTLTGMQVYTKGRISREAGKDVYYFLVSSKRAE